MAKSFDSARHGDFSSEGRSTVVKSFMCVRLLDLQANSTMGRRRTLLEVPLGLERAKLLPNGSVADKSCG